MAMGARRDQAARRLDELQETDRTRRWRRGQSCCTATPYSDRCLREMRCGAASRVRLRDGARARPREALPRVARAPAVVSSSRSQRAESHSLAAAMIVRNIAGTEDRSQCFRQDGRYISRPAAVTIRSAVRPHGTQKIAHPAITLVERAAASFLDSGLCRRSAPAGRLTRLKRHARRMPADVRNQRVGTGSGPE